MFKNNKHFFYSFFVTLFLFSVSFFSNTASAQGIGGSLGGNINLQGVGAVALSCASSSGALSNVGLPFGENNAMDNVAFDDVMSDGDGTITDPASEINENGETVPFGGDTQSSLQNSGMGQTVPVTDRVVQEATKIIKKNTTTIKIEEQKMTKKERCEDKIARFIVLQAMDKITFSTLEWINSGFEGKPFFVENPGQFFGDLAAKEILGFTSEISGDANLFPFGATLVRSILVSFQRTAQQNMMNSLNNVLAHGTRAEWEYDFSVGGWAGYTAYVEPNNNIFGSYLESSQILGRKLEGTRTSTAINFQRELEQGLGFLSKRYCAQTEHGGTYIPENSIQHTVVGVSEITNINQIPTNVYTYITACEADDVFDEDGDGQADSDGLCEGFDEDVVAIAEEFRGRSVCTNWQTSTPGHQIAQQATKVVGMSQDQLLLADEINEDLGLIFDALLNQLISKGLSSFYQESGNYNESNNVAWAQINGFNPGAPEESLPFNDAIGGSGNSEEGDFPGFIAIQEQYISKAGELIGLYQEKTQKTRDLDYCVPGPHPGWQTPAAQQGIIFLESIPMFENMPQETWDGASFLDPGGLFSDFGQEFESEQFYEDVNSLYVHLIEERTGVSIDQQDLNPQLVSRNQHFFPIFYQMFSEYAQLINERFINANDFDNNLRSKASSFFSQITNNQNNINQIQNTLTTVTQTLEDLIDLREEYAVVEHAHIIQYLQSAIQQGSVGLTDNLQTFQSLFNQNQITYIGANGQNTPYHDAVNALTTEIGEPVLPLSSNPEYAQILQDFLQILPNAATQENIQELEDEIEQVTEDIGDQTDDDSLIGLIYSCIYQVNNPGEDSFDGFPGRKAYPFPLSNEIPGLTNLPTTLTFLPLIKISTSPNDVTINITPSSAVTASQNLQIFESLFMNLGQSLY